MGLGGSNGELGVMVFGGWALERRKWSEFWREPFVMVLRWGSLLRTEDSIYFHQ